MTYQEKQALLNKLRKEHLELTLVKDDEILHAYTHWAMYANCFDINEFIESYLDIPQYHAATCN